MKTLVFGASVNKERYSYKAMQMLKMYGMDVVAIGGRSAKLDKILIQTGHPDLTSIHTITMYMSAARQREHEDYLLGLMPSRIIFNPGAENISLYTKAKANGIEVINACTLVMLRTGQYRSTINN